MWLHENSTRQPELETRPTKQTHPSKNSPVSGAIGT
jgi:hypothetical protein